MTSPVREQPVEAGLIRPRSARQWLDLILGVLIPLGPSVLLHLTTLACLGWVVTGGLFRRSQSRRTRLLRPAAALGASFPVVYLLALRPWMRRWGATAAEVVKPLPGDEMTPDPAFQLTHAVTVDAPIAEAWPWLAQIGQEQGGFYSYAWLENLARCEITNAARIHPEWQARTAGDLVKLHPALALKIGVFDPPHALVLDGWGAFVMEAVDEQHTRLLARSRVGRGFGKWMYELLIEIPHFIMQRKMLLEIKARAERSAVHAQR